MMAYQEEVNKLHQLAETYVLLQITYFFIFPFEVKFHLNKHCCSRKKQFAFESAVN